MIFIAMSGYLRGSVLETVFLFISSEMVLLNFRHGMKIMFKFDSLLTGIP